MNGAPLTYAAPPSKLLTADQGRDLVYAGFAAAEQYFNGNNAQLAKYLEDRLSTDKRTAAAGNCAARAGMFWLSYLLWITGERSIATFTPSPPSPWDFLYRAAKSEASIWQTDCALRILETVNALRQRMPGVHVSYEAPKPALEKAPPPAPPAQQPVEADKVQRIEIVAMPHQAMAITQMPPPGPLQVDIASMPATITETVLQRHPNTDEIEKTVATTRPAKERVTVSAG